jgi:Flp pilus assembly protein TadG
MAMAIKAAAAASSRSDGILGQSGAALVEFALLAPVLLLIMLGTAQFGLTLNQYVMLWNGAGAGAMQFAISGGASSTPSSNAWKAITGQAPTLTTTNLKMTLSVNGTACVTNASSLTAAAAGDSACSTALQANAGTPAVVLATYPCDLKVMQYNFSPSCSLSAQITELVQ